MKKFYQKLMSIFADISVDKYLHLIAGLLIAAFFYISLHMEVCIVPVIFAAFAKEFYDEWSYRGASWKDFICTLVGGGLIQILVVLGNYLNI